MKQLADGRIVVPIYDTVKKEVVWVAPGVRDARLDYNNNKKVRFNDTIRGRKGRYLPAEEAPQPEVEKEAPAAEEKKTTRRRSTRKTNTDNK